MRLAVRVESAAALLMDHAEGKVARAWPRPLLWSIILYLGPFLGSLKGSIRVSIGFLSILCFGTCYLKGSIMK